MKNILFLSGVLSVRLIFGMSYKDVLIENNSNRTISIGYKDPACCIVEKLQPHKRLVLDSSIPFLIIRYQNNQHKIRLENIGYHFVVEAKKDGNEGDLIIREYDDRYILKRNS